MTVAASLGLDVAKVETIGVDGRPVLVVERYDRTVDPDGTVRRIHQEDLCQALGLPPKQKYEQDAGPSHLRIARELDSYAEPSAQQTLLRAITLNVALGNCDAHAKNLSLLHTEAGAIRLAPLYDLLSTRLYPGLDDRLASERLERAQACETLSIDRPSTSETFDRSRPQQPSRARPRRYPSQGLTRRMPIPSKWRVLRVARVALRAEAMPAICTSRISTVRPAR